MILKKGYAPPEQYAGNGRIGAWTDVYALAVTIYQMLTGQMPPPAPDRLLAEESTGCPKWGQMLSDSEMERVIKKGMALRIEERYQTMEEFWNALQAVSEPGAQKTCAGKKLNEERKEQNIMTTTGGKIMEYVTCKNGHRYDPSITPECPECAKQYQTGQPLEKTSMGIEQAGYGIPPHWADAKNYREANYASDSYAPTMPVNYQKDKNASMTLPVTGWLVCIEGASKGQDYRIHEEYNYIGRSSKMDICIQGDPTVSRENHAIIAYDTIEKIFYFAPSGGGSIVRVNGRAVLGNVELKAYDRLTIGQSSFLFIPFCGEKFVW